MNSNHRSRSFNVFLCYSEDETGADVRYYSTLDQFDTLLACLDEHGAEKLLAYRLQKRYHDIARCMQITADLSSTLADLPSNDEENEQNLSMFTDGLTPGYLEESIVKSSDYEQFIERIKLRIKPKEDLTEMPGQIDGIVDEDNEGKETKSSVKKREFFVHSTNNYAYSSKFNGQNHYTNDFSQSNGRSI